ncbi:MAG: hypothetical protein ACJ0GB_01280, partial [Candidatus Actinomarina sp.]
LPPQAERININDRSTKTDFFLVIINLLLHYLNNDLIILSEIINSVLLIKSKYLILWEKF